MRGSHLIKFANSLAGLSRMSRVRVAAAACMVAAASAGFPSFAVAQTTTFGGTTATCSPTPTGTSCTYSGGPLNGFSSTSTPTSINLTNGSCTISASLANGVPVPSTVSASPTCSPTQVSAFSGIGNGTSTSVAVLTQSLGLIAQNTSQVGVGVVHTVTTGIRDMLQNRGSSSSAALRYNWDPDADDDLLGYEKSKSVSKSPVFKAMPKAPLMRTVTYAMWGQGFGDVEWRSGTFGGVDVGRTTSTVGGIGGVDATVTNIFSATDAYVIGVLGGYTSARVRNNDGSSARVDGPGVGFYTIYVNGGFSTDSTFKVDFFDLSRSAAGVPDLGLGLTSYTSAYNVNYKVDMMPWWVEPTVGVSYSSLRWDGASKAMGFEDGHTWRLQAGVRVGSAFDWNGVKVEPTLTGMVYSDVEVRGGTIAAAAGGLAIPTDEGKVFGQGIAKLNFIWANNVSSYIEGEVRGRENVLGAAGRVGLRYSF